VQVIPYGGGSWACVCRGLRVRHTIYLVVGVKPVFRIQLCKLSNNLVGVRLCLQTLV
jgi:hypothetical protein